MSNLTPLELDDTTIDALQELARINRDSVKGFNEAADEIEDVDLAELFRDIAGRRQLFAQQLSQYVTINDEEPGEGTSLSSKLHRGWIDVKGAITGKDRHSILTECHRGEDAIKEKYQDLLPKVAGSPIMAELNEQFVQINTTHDLIADMVKAAKDQD